MATLKRLRVRLKASDPAGIARTFKQNLGAGGVFIKTSKPLPVGTGVLVELQYADGRPALGGRGEVAWVREASGTVPPGVAIDLRWDDGCRALLEQVLASGDEGIEDEDAPLATPLTIHPGELSVADLRRAAPDLLGGFEPGGDPSTPPTLVREAAAGWAGGSLPSIPPVPTARRQAEDAARAAEALDPGYAPTLPSAHVGDARGPLPPLAGPSLGLPPLSGASADLPPLPGASADLPPLPGASADLPPLPGASADLPPLGGVPVPGSGASVPPMGVDPARPGFELLPTGAVLPSAPPAAAPVWGGAPPGWAPTPSWSPAAAPAWPGAVPGWSPPWPASVPPAPWPGPAPIWPPMGPPLPELPSIPPPAPPAPVAQVRSPVASEGIELELEPLVDAELEADGADALDFSAFGAPPPEDAEIPPARNPSVPAPAPTAVLDGADSERISVELDGLDAPAEDPEPPTGAAPIEVALAVDASPEPPEDDDTPPWLRPNAFPPKDEPDRPRAVPSWLAARFDSEPPEADPSEPVELSEDPAAPIELSDEASEPIDLSDEASEPIDLSDEASEPIDLSDEAWSVELDVDEPPPVAPAPAVAHWLSGPEPDLDGVPVSGEAERLSALARAAELDVDVELAEDDALPVPELASSPPALSSIPPQPAEEDGLDEAFDVNVDFDVSTPAELDPLAAALAEASAAVDDDGRSPGPAASAPAAWPPVAPAPAPPFPPPLPPAAPAPQGAVAAPPRPSAPSPLPSAPPSPASVPPPPPGPPTPLSSAPPPPLPPAPPPPLPSAPPPPEAVAPLGAEAPLAEDPLSSAPARRDFDAPDPDLPARSRLCVGIDLGTTYSCAAIVIDGKAKVLPSRRGASSIPSAIAIDAEGRLLIGEPAMRQLSVNPANTVVGSKRLLGRDMGSPVVDEVRQHYAFPIVEGAEGQAAVQLADRVLSIEDVAAHLLKEIRESVSLHLKEEVNRAVIACPAYFQERQRHALREAGRRAGFHVERVINEPTAAALNYGFGRSLEERKILVYDLGGGTFDVSLMMVAGEVYEVLATGGDTFLGGIDFDERIARLLIQEIKTKYKLDARADDSALGRLMTAAERAKRDLSDYPSTIVRLDYFTVSGSPPTSIEVMLERFKVERFWESLVERTLAACDDVCRRAGVAPADVDDVILVGGMSRAALVRRKVREFFGKEPRREAHPDEAVALGAAQFAASLGTDDGVLLIDALPMSIGVSLPGGRFKRIIERDAKLPVSRTYHIRTTHDGQTALKVVVFQGDAELVEDNELVGTLFVHGLPAGPKGSESVEVHFEVTGEGLLRLTAKVESTGKQVTSRFVTQATPDDLRQTLQLPAPDPREAVGGTGALQRGAAAAGGKGAKKGKKGVWGWLKGLLGSEEDGAGPSA